MSSGLINVAQVYDLKGLTRNRMVQRTGRENEVLLDENLVQGAIIRRSARLLLIQR